MEARVWQALNRHKAPRPKTFAELGIDIKSLMGTK